MYDVLFIDDNFSEIKDTFLALKTAHVRCFYSDGSEESIPDSKEKNLFNNLQYICLDYYLENRGINKSASQSKNPAATLAGIVKNFSVNPEKIKIIINTSDPDDFSRYEQDFKKYLGVKGEYEIHVEGKKGQSGSENKFSILHEKKEVYKKLLAQSIPQSLRNVVIKEAIEIENIIWQKVKEAKPDIEELIKILPTKDDPTFSIKVKLFNKYCSSSYTKKLNALRELRNELAHEGSPSIEEQATKFSQEFNSEFSYDIKTVLSSTLSNINTLKEGITNVS